PGEQPHGDVHEPYDDGLLDRAVWRARRWCVCPTSAALASTHQPGGAHMESHELSQLVIARPESDADLAALIEVRRLVTPEARPTVENLRFNLESDEALVYLVAYAGADPAGCGFVQAWEEMVYADIGVAPAYRRRGIGTALLADVRERARSFGRDEIQGGGKESDVDARGVLER